MKVKGDFVFLGVVEKPGFKDPTVLSYYVSIQDKDKETALCGTDEVTYKLLKSREEYKPVSLVLNYNPRYKSLRVVDILK